MNRITLRKKHTDATLVSNYFIDEYMTNANEAQIKVYLYLLRCLGSNLPISVSIMADRFNYTEKDILRALIYWERCGILSIEYDSSQNIVGICVNDCTQTESATSESTQNTESVQPEPVQVAAGEPVAQNAKPFYSMEQMNAFKGREDIQELIFTTEFYFGKPLSVKDIQSLLYMYEDLKFPVSLMEYVVEYCVNAGHKSMRYIEKVAMEWAERGIHSVEEAKSLGDSSRYRKECYAVLREFGITGRSIVESDLAFVTKWIDEYYMPIDVILDACKRTVATISKPSFSYADGILSRWYKNGVKKLSDIQAEDAKHLNSKRNMSNTKAVGNRYKNFTERDDDYNAIADMIMEQQVPL